MKWIKWLYPGLNFKRWLFCFALGTILTCVGVTLFLNYQFVGLIETTIFKIFSSLSGAHYSLLIKIIGFSGVIVGIALMIYGTRHILRTVRYSVMPDAKEPLRELLFTRRKLDRGPNIVVIGGGTGLSVLLRGVKTITSKVTAVVTTGDNGGSSGRLREELGIIPPGDMRNCLVALADTEPLMESVMQYRFASGSSMEGHSLGNLFIAALADVCGGTEEGLRAMSDILKVRGSVVPSSTEAIQLKAVMLDGSVVVGESEITASQRGIKQLMTEPESPRASQSAINAIMQADAVILGPGSLYTSVIASMIIPGIREALLTTKAQKIYVCNVMTQPGETDGYGAYEHVKAIIDHAGRQILDYVIVNEQAASPQQIVEYELKGAKPVTADIEKIRALGITVVPAKLLNNSNLVRHNPARLAQTIIRLVYRLKLLGRGIQFFDYFFARQTMREVEQKQAGEAQNVLCK